MERGAEGVSTRRRQAAAWWLLLAAWLVATPALAFTGGHGYLFVGAATTDTTPMRECSPEVLQDLHVAVIPAPAGGWPGTPQAINVFNVFGGEVMVAVGDREVCGRTHDARTRDSRFRAGVGLVVVPAAGSLDPIRVGWRLPVKPHWIPTVRLGAPSDVQHEDTARLLVRASCLAIALALAFSALMGFLGTRDRGFLSQFVMCLLLLLWQSVLNGLSGYPQPWLPVVGHEARWLIGLSAFGFASIVFVLWGLGGRSLRLPPLRAARGWLTMGFVAIGWAVTLVPEAALRGLWRFNDYAFVAVTAALLASVLPGIRRGEHRALALSVSVLPLLLMFVPALMVSRPMTEYRIELIQLVLTWFLVVMAYISTSRLGQLRQQRDAMRVLADTDVLTGVLNRRGGLARLDALFVDARVTGLPLSVGFVDVDRFKRINDTHGHAIGDRVLVRVAEAISQSMRDPADVVRMGGEEFLVLLPGVDSEQSRQRLESIRGRIAQITDAMDVRGLEISASIGLATLAQVDDDVASLLRRADGAMYAAKQQGRNRIVVAGDASQAAP